MAGGESRSNDIRSPKEIETLIRVIREPLGTIESSNDIRSPKEIETTTTVLPLRFGAMLVPMTLDLQRRLKHIKGDNHQQPKHVPMTLDLQRRLKLDIIDGS